MKNRTGLEAEQSASGNPVEGLKKPFSDPSTAVDFMPARSGEAATKECRFRTAEARYSAQAGVSK